MALTLKQLLRATPSVVQKSSKRTAILEAKKSLRKNGTSILTCKVKRQLNDGIKHGKHICSIESIDPAKPKLSEGYVKVSCSCEAFTFWGIEYVLNKKGAADIKHSNGKPPDVRNPGRVIFLCPHLTKVGLAVLLKGM